MDILNITNKFNGEVFTLKIKNRNKLKPTKHGVGYNDVHGASKSSNHIILSGYNRYNSMLSRCYNKNCRNFKDYGAKGFYVCDEWHYLSNYLTWFLENYEEGKSIDKDILGRERRVYSPETCIFVTYKENILEVANRKDYSEVSGVNSCFYKDIEYYSKIPVVRSSFKCKCNKEGWKIDEFEEVDSGIKIGTKRKFYYIYDKNKAEEQRKQKVLDVLKYYETNKVETGSFLKYCKNNNLNPQDFVKECAGRSNLGKFLYFYTYDPIKANEQRILNELSIKNRYSNTGIRRSTFKGYCKTHNLVFEEYNEVFSHITKSECGKITKYYFYILKINY